jgi:hypothetical protein
MCQTFHVTFTRDTFIDAHKFIYAVTALIIHSISGKECNAWYI